MTLTHGRIAELRLGALGDPAARQATFTEAGELLDLLAEKDAEVERLSDTEKAQGVMIRELERLNTELNDELGTAVQVLKLERDGLRVEVERLIRERREVEQQMLRNAIPALVERDALIRDLRAALAEGGA